MLYSTAPVEGLEKAPSEPSGPCWSKRKKSRIDIASLGRLTSSKSSRTAQVNSYTTSSLESRVLLPRLSFVHDKARTRALRKL
jgi:hypothetical protein